MGSLARITGSTIDRLMGILHPQDFGVNRLHARWASAWDAGVNYLKLLGIGVLAGLAVMGGACAKKTEEVPPVSAAPATVTLVAESERSRHFMAVTDKLELGGTVYAYADIDGDVEKFAILLRQLIEPALAQQPMAAAFLPKDLAPIFADLGLTDLKAVGLSSVPDASGVFRNNLFLYAPNGRSGLFAGLGGPAKAYVTPGLVAPDTDLVYETELDLTAVYQAVRSVIVRVAGEPVANLAEAKMKEVDPKIGVAPLDALQKAKGRASIALRIDESRTHEVEAGVTLPLVDLLVRVEGVGSVIDAMATKAGLAREVRADGSIAFTVPPVVPPALGWTLAFVVSGDVATITTGDAMRPAAGAATLAGDTSFQAALAQVGETGNGLLYLSPRFSTVASRLIAQAATKAPPEARIGFAQIEGFLPPAGVQLIGTRQNLPDGILFRGRSHTSNKALVMANPSTMVVGTGLVAAMAIPAFQKVRTNSQQKMVLNNLRQLSAARDQYFLETGKTTCTYADLVGPGPDKYIRQLKPVAGEDYTTLVFAEGKPIEVTLPGGRTVSYEE